MFDLHFNLISKKDYESKINEYVFDDIGLKTLFDDFYDHNWSDLLEVMEYIPKPIEIKKRQDIFNDFLNDKDDHLKTFKRYLEELRGAYKNYKSTDGGLKSYILYSQYINKLIKFFTLGCDELNAITLESKEMNEMRNYFNDKVNSDSFKKLVKDNECTYNAYKNMENMIVSYITNDKFIKTNIKTEQVLLIDKLKGILDELNIEYNLTNSNTIRHELDPYYFNRLEYIYPEDYKVLRTFFDTYKDEIEYEYDNLSFNLQYYIKLKALFVHAESKNVTYSKAVINEDYVTDIHDLADISIINKVEQITTNDFHYDLEHHMQIVTGTNGGGKTTYLRSIGANMIIFSSIGYTFSKDALIKPVKYIHSHFPNDENYQVGYGRLQDELRRLGFMKPDFCKDCILMLNETFSSTDEETAFKESMKLFEDVTKNQVNMIFITHQQTLLRNIDREKIALLNPIVDSEHGNKRLFKIRKVENQVHAFAEDILRKYGLSKEDLRRRKEEMDV